jgi:hypothetical protein
MNDGAGNTVFCLRDNCFGVIIINYNSWEGLLIFEETDLLCSKKVLTGNNTVNLRLCWRVERAYACII